MTLKDEMMKVAVEYMGPAAERFMKRQVKSHLNKTLTTISKEDLPELAKWIEISAGLLIDKEEAKQFKQEIKALA